VADFCSSRAVARTGAGVGTFGQTVALQRDAYLAARIFLALEIDAAAPRDAVEPGTERTALGIETVMVESLERVPRDSGRFWATS